MAQTSTQQGKELRAGQTEAVEAANINASKVEDKAVEQKIATVAEMKVAEAGAAKFAVDICKAMQAYVKQMSANAYKSMTGTISEIMGPIWDEFKGMSPFAKFLVVVGCAAIVGAVGFFSWKLIAGNWTSIRQFVGDQLGKCSELVTPKTVTEKEQTAVASVTNALEKKDEEAKISKETSQDILKYVFKALGAGIAEGILTAVKTAEDKVASLKLPQK